MEVATRPRPPGRRSDFLWRTEQKIVYLFAISLGISVGILVGLFRALKSLAPHFTSVQGVKRLYYGDPSAAPAFQRSYLKGSYNTAQYKQPGSGALLSSSDSGKTDRPALVNGEHSAAGLSSTAQTSSKRLGDDNYPLDKELLEREHLYTNPEFASSSGSEPSAGKIPAANKHAAPVSFKEASQSIFQEDSALDNTITPKSTTTVASKDGPTYDSHTPKSELITPAETEGDTETEDEGAGSEYTASSAPTTPRSSVLAPPGDVVGGEGKKKKRKKIGRKIKKTFSKIADAFTPSSHPGTPKSAAA